MKVSKIYSDLTQGLNLHMHLQKTRVKMQNSPFSYKLGIAELRRKLKGKNNKKTNIFRTLALRICLRVKVFLVKLPLILFNIPITSKSKDQLLISLNSF